jgi:acetolactate synthase-1/2/3 large subunit
MPRLTGGRAVVEALEREGVDVVFGMPGIHTLEAYDAFLDSDVDPITTRHEQAAGFMADGYARTTGRVGVCLVITGPGLTNALTAVAQAYSDSSPILVVSSQNPTNEAGRGKGYLHELKDQGGMMENVVEYSETVERVGDVPGAVADAFEHLRGRRPRPVHLQVPTDVLEREEPVTFTDRGRPDPGPVDDDRLDAVATRLVDADRPLFLVGGGATGATEEARRLVETVGLPVVTTVAGKGVIPESHPRSLGARLGVDVVDEFVESRDLVLAVGTELGPRDVRDVKLPGLVHVDLDYTNFGRNHPTELGVVADAATALAGITDRVGGEVDPPAVDLPGDLPRAAVDAADDRHRVLGVLREYLDDDAIVVNDMTKLSYAAKRAFPTDEPGTFLFPSGYGTLGFSPPAAFGAAMGTPDRQVVSLVGDGGVLFTVGDLATAVKYDLSVPMIVINDDRYGVIHDVQTRDYGGRTVGTDVENPDFVAMARSFGAAAERVDVDRVETDLPTALDAAFDRDGPTLVELPVDF